MMATIDRVPYSQTSLQEPNDAAQIVSTQISTIQSAAEGALAAAQTAIANLGSITSEIAPSQVDFGATPNITVGDVSTEFAPAPQYDDIGDFSGHPVFKDADLKAREVQPFSVTPPTVSAPGKWFMRPTGKPMFDRSQLVRMNLPTDGPDLDPNQILSRIKEMIANPGITEEIPGYTPVNYNDVPGITLADPLERYKERLFRFSESLTDTEITEYLIADIIASLSSGGRGLPEGTENALFLRAKDRLADEYEDTYNKEDARLAAQGWIIPTGAHVAALADITARRNRALEQASHEAMIENARLVIQDRHQAREVAVRFEEVFRTYLAGYYARSLEANKELAAESLKVFQIALEQNKLLFENARLRVDLYDAFIKGSLMELQAFDMKLGMKKVVADIRGQDADMIMKWADAMLAEAQVYESRMKGAIAVAGQNKAVVEQFGEEVRAYIGEMQAYGEDVKAWIAEMDAAYKPLDAFGALVKAYEALAGAVESQNRVEASKGELALKQNELNLEAFRGEVQAFMARAQVAAEKNRTEGTKISAEAQVHAATVSAKADIETARARVASAQVDAETNRIAIAVENNKVNIQKSTNELLARVEAMKGVAQAAAQLASSIYAGINVGASISNGMSVSRSTAHAYSASISNSLSEEVQ